MLSVTSLRLIWRGLIRCSMVICTLTNRQSCQTMIVGAVGYTICCRLQVGFQRGSTGISPKDGWIGRLVAADERCLVRGQLGPWLEVGGGPRPAKKLNQNIHQLGLQFYIDYNYNNTSTIEIMSTDGRMSSHTFRQQSNRWGMKGMTALNRAQELVHLNAREMPVVC